MNRTVCRLCRRRNESAAVCRLCRRRNESAVCRQCRGRMTLDDFEQLLAQQTADSSPGMSGISYGHLRSMSRKHRLLFLEMVNRFLQLQHCPFNTAPRAGARGSHCPNPEVGRCSRARCRTTNQPDRIANEASHCLGCAKDKCSAAGSPQS